jgi:hypothetical protein
VFAQNGTLSFGFRVKLLFRSLKIRKKQSASISDERDR